jgi:MoxR-like ATPase
MGRASGQQQSKNGSITRRGQKGGVSLQRISSDQLVNDALEAKGEVIVLADGTEITLDGSTPATLLQGLDQIEGITYAGTPGQYEITFKDGTKAMVDTERGAIAFSSGDDFTQAQLQGAMVMAMAQQGTLADLETADDNTLAMADALKAFKDGNPQALVDLAKSGGEALQSQEDSLLVNVPDLQRELNGSLDAQENGGLSPSQQAKRRLEHSRGRLADAYADGGSDAAVGSLLFDAHMAEDGTTEYGPTSEQRDERQAAAEKLGAIIPESRISIDEDGKSVGAFEVTDDIRTKFYLVRNSLASGQRAFLFRGPPGTGKDTFAYEVAALQQMPIVSLNIGPSFSFEDAISGDALEAKTVDGQTVTVSTGKAGPLAQALQEPCMIVIQEPEGMEHEAVRLHSVFGDNVGEPGTRRLTLNTVNGPRDIDVHEDCIIAFTYNSGEEDVRFKTALHDRACNLSFEYPTEEEEAKRYSKMVTSVMNRDGMKEEAPELAREYSPEEMLPVVKLMTQLREAHRTNPDAFVDVPGSRQGVMVMTNLLLQGYGGDEDPMSTISERLDYLLPGSENMPREERMSYLREQFTDIFTEFDAIARRARESREDV